MLCMARQCWEQGVAAQAMLECGDNVALVLLARDCVVRQNADGRLCDVENTPALVDPAICVEPVLAAGKLLGDESMIRAAQRNVGFLLACAPATVDGARYHLLGDTEVWADSLAMGPHVLMLAGYAEEGWNYYQAIRKRLWDEKTGLFRHKWSERKQRFVRASFWGVGNGWALVGMMRMYKALKEQKDARADMLAKDFGALANAMLPWQTKKGLFYDVLDDSSTFLESECTEMFAYAVYAMAHLGITDERWIVAANRARAAVLKRVDGYGILQGCSGSPTFEREGTSVEGQAHLIMMENAATRMEL